MKIELDPKFTKKVQGMFGKYQFQVGILEDGPHKDAMKRSRGKTDNLTSYAGGPVRKKTRTSSTTLAQVSKENRERMQTNYLTEPFKETSSDIMKFTEAFFKLVFGRSQKRRCENLLQAIVRNPILRGEYGPQSKRTTKRKGFERPMIDTAQLFKAIIAECKVGRKRA